MPPNRFVLAMLLLAPAIGAGCIAPTLDVPEEGAAVVSASALPALPAGADPFSMILCAGDRLDPIASALAHDCNTHVTKDWGAAAEVSFAVNPVDPLNIVGGGKDFTLGEDARCGKYLVWSGAYTSFDGGRTWNTSLLPGHRDDPTGPLAAYDCGSDPVLAFGPEGIVYYASLQYSDAPDSEPPHPALGPIFGGQARATVAVTRSLDGGRTWEESVLVATHEGERMLDKEWMAVDSATGQVYVSYTDGRGLHVQRSDDLGLSWTEPVTLVSQSNDRILDLFQFAQIAVGKDSLVHFTYFHVKEDTGAVYHMRSDDAGATWNAPRMIASMPLFLDLGSRYEYRRVGMPAIAADPASGAVYVAYLPRDTGDSNVFLATSLDGGDSWSTMKVNDDLAGPLNDQWMTAIAVGPGGTVHLTWLDHRDDPTGAAARVYHSFSTDQGRTWSANQPLSSAAFTGKGGYHQSGSGTIGDYMALAASPAAVHAFWADTRDGRNDVFGATLPGPEE